MRCPYCNGIVIYSQDRGEYVCTQCGTVIDRVYVHSISSINQSSIIDNREIDLVTYVKRELSKVNTSVIKLNILRKLNYINFYLRISSQSYLKVLECLRKISQKLGLKDKQLQLAEQLFVNLVKKFRSSGIKEEYSITYYKVAAACILYVVITHNLPISLKEIVREFQNEGHRVSQSDITNLLTIINKRFSYNTADRILTYSKLILNKLNIRPEVKVEIYKKLSRFINQVFNTNLKIKLLGKNPRNLAGALTYMFLKNYGVDIELSTISSILSTSLFTLRDYVRKLSNLVTYAQKVS